MQQVRFLEWAVCAMALVASTSTSALAQEAGDCDFFSRITVAAPLFTHHFPKDGNFNDHNWGGVIFYELSPHFSLAGGDFVNSYRRNTAFAGVSITPWTFALGEIQIAPGALAGVDLNAGYRGYDPIEPMLAAGTIKFGTVYFSDPHYQFLNRFGLLMTVIPGFGNNRSTASNLALTIRL